MAMIFKQPGKTGMEILKHVGLSIEDKNHINKIVNNRNKRMKLNSTIFFLCAGLCSSALIENAFSMDDKVVSTRTFFNEKGKLGRYHMMVVSKYFEDIDDFRNLEFATPKAYKNTDKWHMNPISITPDQLHLWSGLQTLHLYTMEDLNNWGTYTPDEKFIDQLPSGNLKDASGLFYKVEIHVPYDMKEIKKSNLLDSMKDRFIFIPEEDDENKNVAKYPIRFRNVRVNRDADIGHVDPKTGQFIFNDDIYTGYKENKEVSIDESDNSYVIRNIPHHCFSRLKSLKSILIPNTVEYIGNSAFEWCENLTNLTIGNNVKTIDAGAFEGCTSLENVTIPDSVTYIGESAFGCAGVTEITIPNSVTSITRSAFAGCKWLSKITIPNSVTSITRNAFSGCTGLSKITIPNSVTHIGSWAFYRCKLTSITIPDSVTSVSDDAFIVGENLNKVFVYSDRVKQLIRTRCYIDPDIIEVIEKPENERK